MKRAMGLAIFVVCVGVLFSSPLAADTFDPDKVSADAKWAIHLDVERMISSRIGEHFKDMLGMECDFKEVEVFGDMLGFDPFEDVHGVTLYGESFDEEEGVVLVKGRFDKEKVLDLMDEEDVDFDEFDYEDVTIYTVTDGGDRFYFCFYKHGMALFSNSKKLMKEALDVLEGERESLAETGKLKGMRSLPEGTFFAMAAQGFDGILGLDDEPGAAVLQKAESVHLAAGELEGDNFVKATLVTSDKETAKQVHDVVRGLIALGSMLELENQEPELREIAKFLRTVKISQDGRKVTLFQSCPAADLIRLLGKMM